MFTCLPLLSFLASLTAQSVESVVIRIDPSQREVQPVPPEFMGQFGEHLGCNVYNGQSAQILRNPGFEGWEYFEGYELHLAQHVLGLTDVTAGRERGLACYWLPEGEATYALDPDAFNSNYAQRIETTSRGGVRAPVMLPTHRVLTYDVSFYAHADRVLPCKVFLRGVDGSVLAEQQVRIQKGPWRCYEKRLHLRQAQPKGAVYELVILVNEPGIVWLDQATLHPTDHIDGLDPDLVAMMRELHVSLLRFPGGNFASGYHWRDGIGPMEKRVSKPNPAWGGIETNQFGTVEWVNFARAIGAEPLICVNCGSGTPEEAAEWVRFCNDPPSTPLGALRASCGQREPFNVRYWEVGNELWGPWQIGHCTPEEYAARYDAFSKAMLAADPNILLIANGGDGDWNERFLRSVKEPVRSLSIHRLIGDRIPSKTDPSHLFMALAGFGRVFETELAQMRETAAACGAPNVSFALTEVMSVAMVPPGLFSASTMGEVAYFAGMMNACIRNRDKVELITRTAVVNHGGGRAKIREIVFREPVHHLSRIYGNIVGRFPIACQTNAPRYSVMVPGMPVIKDIPALETLAVVNNEGTEVTLLVLNITPDRGFDAKIQLDGFPVQKTVTRQEICAPPLAFNTWGEPDRVALRVETVAFPEHSVFHFPGGSFTALTFRRDSAR